MDDLLKRSQEERLIIAKSLLESVINDITGMQNAVEMLECLYKRYDTYSTCTIDLRDFKMSWSACLPTDVGRMTDIIDPAYIRAGTVEGDLISRQDVINVLDERARSTFSLAQSFEWYCNALSDVAHDIEQLPSAQPEVRTEMSSADTISRQAAIDALDKRFDSIPMKHTTEILLLRKDLRDLPSAQPKTNCSEFPNNSDTISRQAAIQSITGYNGVMDKSVAKRLLMQLPSAQPEIIR